MIKEFTQDPKLYQLFSGIQISTLGISFEIGSLVKLTFGLMGSNNALLADTPPVDMGNKLPIATSTEFITLSGSWKLKMPGDAQPIEYIDGISIELSIDNEMSDLQGLFQTEAIDKSLGMLRITGTITELLHDLDGQGKGGKLYNLAKQGGDAELHITVISEKDDAEYEFILNIGLDSSTLDDGDNIAASIPFSTYGENRFMLRKTVPAAAVPVTGVTLDQTSLNMNVGDTEQITATVDPANATNQVVTWASSDSGIVDVDQDGNIEAIAAGQATITVTTDDGNFTADCDVTVS